MEHIIHLTELTEPHKHNNLLISEFDISGEEYYRDYSFIDRPFSLYLNEIEQEKRKQDILNYTSRTPIITKNQQYANKARGISQHRKKAFASQSTGKQTNPNSNNLIRVDRNKLIINESPYTEVPYIKTSIPYTHDLSNNIYTDGNMIATKIRNSTNNTIQVPRVENRSLPAEESILEGGVLYAGTKFIPDVTERDDYQPPSMYKISEKAIVDSDFAERFEINVKETYTDEELLEITGKAMLELYPWVPSWEKDDRNNGVKWNQYTGHGFGSVVHNSPDFNTLGDFLPSMYNRANYNYDPVKKEYFPTITQIVWYKPSNTPDEYNSISTLEPYYIYNAYANQNQNP